MPSCGAPGAQHPDPPGSECMWATFPSKICLLLEFPWGCQTWGHGSFPGQALLAKVNNARLPPLFVVFAATPCTLWPP